MRRAVILATGLYILVDGVTVAYFALNVPHPVGECQQERELSGWAQERMKRLAVEAIPEALIGANLATTDPRHSWCAPRYQIRKTVEPDEPIAQPAAVLPRRAPLPPRRPIMEASRIQP